jgi:RNA polymerase sigma factor FliA
MNELIESHLGYAHAIAAELVSRYPANVTRQDLESAAELGLVQAARVYDPAKGVAFKTFAYYRIRGAIFDEIRDLCRNARFDIAANEQMIDLSAEAATMQTSGEVYGELTELASRLVSSYLLSLDSISAEAIEERTLSPAGQMLQKEECRMIQRALRQLPERYRSVLHAYYYEDLSMESIGERMKLSKSWVSRLHSQALSALRNLLQPSAVFKGAAARDARMTAKLSSNSHCEEAITRWVPNESYSQQTLQCVSDPI